MKQSKSKLRIEIAPSRSRSRPLPMIDDTFPRITVGQAARIIGTDLLLLATVAVALYWAIAG